MKLIHQDPELRAQRVAAIKVRCHAKCFIGVFLLNAVVDLGMFVFPQCYWTWREQKVLLLQESVLLKFKRHSSVILRTGSREALPWNCLVWSCCIGWSSNCLVWSCCISTRITHSFTLLPFFFLLDCFSFDQIYWLTFYEKHCNLMLCRGEILLQQMWTRRT